MTTALKEVVLARKVSVRGGLDRWNDSIVAKAKATGNTRYTECAEVEEVPNAYLCASHASQYMNEQLTRASFYSEGFAREGVAQANGQVVPLKDPIVGHYQQTIGGHDIKSEELREFFGKIIYGSCDQTCSNDMNRAEIDFFRGFLEQRYSTGEKFVVISYSIDGFMYFGDVASHELMHAQYFLSGDYEREVSAYWDGMPEEDREAVRTALKRSYDINNPYVLKNEFQAYLLQTGATAGHLASLVPKHAKALRDRLDTALRPLGREVVQVETETWPTQHSEIRAITCQQLAKYPAKSDRIFRIEFAPAEGDAAQRASISLSSPDGKLLSSFAGELTHKYDEATHKHVWEASSGLFPFDEVVERKLVVSAHENQRDLLTHEAFAYLYENDEFRAYNKCMLTRGSATSQGTSLDQAVNQLVAPQSKEEAAIASEAFATLPTNARELLLANLTIKAGDPSVTIVLADAPKLFRELHAALVAKGDRDAYRHAVAIGLTTCARVFQEGRIATKRQVDGGTLAVDLRAIIAAAAQSPAGLDEQGVSLTVTQDRATATLAARPSFDLAPFATRRLTDLAAIDADTVGVIGIGGGSDVVQAAQIGALLERAGKEVRFAISVRTAKFEAGKSRTIEGHGGMVTEGVYRVTPTSSGSGRFLENLPAERFPTYLVLDELDGSLGSRLQAAMADQGGAPLLIAVDTGGDALYSTQVVDGAKATPDQDLRVLKTLRELPVTVLTAEIAVGVDSPANAQDVLLKANARYFELDAAEQRIVIDNYRAWDMTGTNEQRFGKTPLAWQAALGGHRGLYVLPLPQRVVLDRTNPWDPFIFVRPQMAGVFFMDLADHLAAIGER